MNSSENENAQKELPANALSAENKVSESNAGMDNTEESKNEGNTVAENDSTTTSDSSLSGTDNLILSKFSIIQKKQMVRIMNCLHSCRLR